MSFWNLADFSSSDLQTNSQIYFRFLKVLPSITLCALLFVHSSADSREWNPPSTTDGQAHSISHTNGTDGQDPNPCSSPVPTASHREHVQCRLTWKMSCFPNLDWFISPPGWFPFQFSQSRSLELSTQEGEKSFGYNVSSDSKFYLNVSPSPRQDFSPQLPDHTMPA